LVQEPRRSPRPYLIAVVLAVALIVGLRVLTGTHSANSNTGASRGGASPASCGSNTLPLAVSASSEKAALLGQLAAAYNSQGHRVDGRCVRVTVTSKASGAAMTALATGWNETTDGPRPDVWTPASGGWVTLLQQRSLAGDRPKVLPASLNVATLPHIATSPQVIAMPTPMAQALGWPDKKLGWSDLLTLARDGTGWGRYHHPEWGAFKLGKTNPNFSTSGLNATIGAWFAATGLSSDLTDKDLANPKARAFVADLEKSIVHYGDTTLTFLSNLQRADDQGAGLTYISAVVVEEKSVWDYNQGNPTGDPATLGKHAKPKVPLVAIYPKEGTLLSDHPWVVLSAPWVDDAKRAAAADFLAQLQGKADQAQFQRYAFRDFHDQPGALISPPNGLLPKQPASLLAPPAPAVLDHVLTSWNTLRKRANVLIVIDTSGSMSEAVPGTGRSKLDLAKQAALNSLANFANDDRVGLWMFSRQLNGDQDYQELVPVGPMNQQVNGLQRREALKTSIEGLPPGGGTGLYDTALAAFQFVRGHQSASNINAVVLLTDGQNQDDGISLQDLLPQLRSEQGDLSVRLFTIAYGRDADLGVLRQIAEATNAAAYDSSDPTSIDQVFTAVVSNF